jgi:hypothetical protein
MRYSANFEKDFNFYMANKEKFIFCGEQVAPFPFAANGPSAKEAFYKFDSTGKILACAEPELATALLRCKKAINFQLKQWVEGYDDCLIAIHEYLTEFLGEAPPWIERAFRNQRAKTYRGKA